MIVVADKATAMAVPCCDGRIDPSPCFLLAAVIRPPLKQFADWLAARAFSLRALAGIAAAR